MTGITVTRSEGRLLASKPVGPDGADRRRHEAEVLARLDHPGVVQFIDLVEGPPIELLTAFVGPDTWARRPPSDPRAIIDGLASVASTLADLHDLGTAHGSLQSDHVLVAADQRPVLCGLAEAGPATDAACRADLTALAALIDQLARDAPPDQKSRLHALARRAEQGALSARALTTELDTMRTTAAAARPRVRSLPRPGPAVAAIAATAVVAILAFTMSTRSARPDEPAATSTAITEPTTTEPTTTEPTTTEPTTEVLPDPIPDTTTTAAVSEPPPVIQHDGRRYAVGRAGDIIILGDWNCNDTSTPAVLSPSSGVIAFFATWPAPGGSLEPAATVTIGGATELRIDDDPACGRLRALHPGGSTLVDPELS